MYAFSEVMGQILVAGGITGLVVCTVAKMAGLGERDEPSRSALTGAEHDNSKGPSDEKGSGEP